MSVEQKTRKVRVGACALLGLLALLLLLALPVTIVPLSALFRLLFGWFFFLRRVIPDISWNPEMIASGVIALIVATLGFHFLALRFHREWRRKWTVAWIAIGGLLFAASIFTTGIVHQLTWLAREDSVQSFFESDGYRRVRNIADLRTILIGLQVYEMDTESFPSTLGDLFPDYVDLDSKIEKRLWTHLSAGGEHRAWFYFPEAGTLPEEDFVGTLGDSRILVAESEPTAGIRQVGLVSGAVKEITEQEFRQAIRRQIEAVENRETSKP